MAKNSLRLSQVFRSLVTRGKGRVQSNELLRLNWRLSLFGRLNAPGWWDCEDQQQPSKPQDCLVRQGHRKSGKGHCFGRRPVCRVESDFDCFNLSLGIVNPLALLLLRFAAHNPRPR
jgi:hypothetical protein